MRLTKQNLRKQLMLSEYEAECILHTWKTYKEGLISEDRMQQDVTHALRGAGFYGWEYVESGTNKKSPGFAYLNTGDYYCPTLCILFIPGDKKMIISSYEDQIERGNYR